MPSWKSSERNSGTSCISTWCECGGSPPSGHDGRAASSRGSRAARSRRSRPPSAVGLAITRRRHDRVHEAELERLRGGEVVAEDAISQAFAQPTRRGRYQVPPLSGTMPRLAKPGISIACVGHEAHVAAECQVEAVARGGAVDRADHRRVDLEQDRRRQVARAEVGDPPPLLRREPRRRCPSLRRRPSGRDRCRSRGRRR